MCQVPGPKLACAKAGVPCANDAWLSEFMSRQALGYEREFALGIPAPRPMVRSKECGRLVSLTLSSVVCCKEPCRVHPDECPRCDKSPGISPKN
jgi:hypothetical protein